jgi:hypothetical protein
MGRQSFHRPIRFESVHPLCRRQSVDYNFANLDTTFAALAGRSITPPWWMKIGVPSLI